jgi:hypothetical protein
MRRITILLMALAGCGEQVAVVPQGGLERAISSSGSVTMTAFAAPWTGYPEDLTDYLTPIAVELYNAGPYEVRVSFSDFLLRDASGTRYGAINPFLPSRHSRLENQPAVLLAARGGGGRGGGGWSGGRSSSHSAGRVSVGPPSGRRYPGAGGMGIHGGWTGYHINGSARGWYGPGWSYWGAPFLYPPGYATWVWWWGPSYYPSAQPSADVIDEALPEGVLQPGGRVNGYLYFQKATDRARSLDLAWEAHEARWGGFVGLTRVALEVVER